MWKFFLKVVFTLFAGGMVDILKEMQESGKLTLEMDWPSHTKVKG